MLELGGKAMGSPDPVSHWTPPGPRQGINTDTPITASQAFTSSGRGEIGTEGGR